MPLTLRRYLKSNRITMGDGYSQQIPEQRSLLTNIINNDNVKTVMEIGFNGGHSAELILETSDVKLTSFDIGYHSYVKIGKEYIDNKYPERHTLIIGNSIKTVPDFVKNNSNIKFDVIFIDGGHDYKTSKQDLLNCKELAHKDTIVIMDDTVYTNSLKQGWNAGPTKVWLEGIRTKLIMEIGRKDFVNKRKGRGMSWGKYIL